MKRKVLITSFHCDYIECECGSVILNDQRSLVVPCKECGSIYNNSGTLIMSSMESSSLDNDSVLV